MEGDDINCVFDVTEEGIDRNEDNDDCGLVPEEDDE